MSGAFQSSLVIHFLVTEIPEPTKTFSIGLYRGRLRLISSNWSGVASVASSLSITTLPKGRSISFPRLTPHRSKSQVSEIFISPVSMFMLWPIRLVMTLVQSIRDAISVSDCVSPKFVPLCATGSSMMLSKSRVRIVLRAWVSPIPSSAILIAVFCLSVTLRPFKIPEMIYRSIDSHIRQCAGRARQMGEAK